MYRFSERSREKLRGVHPDLILLLGYAIQHSPIDFGISEGLRTEERQKMLVEEGKSMTMNSKHLTGDAVDVFAYIGGKANWDWPYYEKINHAMERASIALDIPFAWGGRWTTFRDGVHFERTI